MPFLDCLESNKNDVLNQVSLVSETLKVKVSALFFIVILLPSTTDPILKISIAFCLNTDSTDESAWKTIAMFSLKNALTVSLSFNDDRS